MGDEVDSVSLCSGFVKKIMNSYLVKAAQDTLKTINKPSATQSETESIFLTCQFKCSLTCHNMQTLKTYKNKTSS
ncbi:hypothetical protein HMPREF1401_01225 [Helicobacter pylori GAM120Ai]|uniref:Uncharacterized protein n=1 Tax=Helicobacter pylori GAM120Ai TaxID=1159029 RepID=A0AAV3IEN3_HELPX|nr:hypothetical protein HMPREF1401_01225 [Helicobacter pylori GAM120Ai]